MTLPLLLYKLSDTEAVARVEADLTPGQVVHLSSASGASGYAQVLSVRRLRPMDDDPGRLVRIQRISGDWTLAMDCLETLAPDQVGVLVQRLAEPLRGPWVLGTGFVADWHRLGPLTTIQADSLEALRVGVTAMLAGLPRHQRVCVIDGIGLRLPDALPVGEAIGLNWSALPLNRLLSWMLNAVPPAWPEGTLQLLVDALPDASTRQPLTAWAKALSHRNHPLAGVLAHHCRSLADAAPFVDEPDQWLTPHTLLRQVCTVLDVSQLNPLWLPWVAEVLVSSLKSLGEGLPLSLWLMPAGQLLPEWLAPLRLGPHRAVWLGPAVPADGASTQGALCQALVSGPVSLSLCGRLTLGFPVQVALDTLHRPTSIPEAPPVVVAPAEPEPIPERPPAPPQTVMPEPSPAPVPPPEPLPIPVMPVPPPVVLPPQPVASEHNGGMADALDDLFTYPMQGDLRSVVGLPPAEAVTPVAESVAWPPAPHPEDEFWFALDEHDQPTMVSPLQAFSDPDSAVQQALAALTMAAPASALMTPELPAPPRPTVPTPETVLAPEFADAPPEPVLDLPPIAHTAEPAPVEAPSPSPGQRVVAGFDVGTVVSHPQYGRGTVQKVIQLEEGRPVLNIQFDTVGKRLVDPTLLPLERG